MKSKIQIGLLVLVGAFFLPDIFFGKLFISKEDAVFERLHQSGEMEYVILNENSGSLRLFLADSVVGDSYVHYNQETSGWNFKWSVFYKILRSDGSVNFYEFTGLAKECCPLGCAPEIASTILLGNELCVIDGAEYKRLPPTLAEQVVNRVSEYREMYCFDEP
jgi:hypothetical protein